MDVDNAATECHRAEHHQSVITLHVTHTHWTLGTLAATVPVKGFTDH